MGPWVFEVAWLFWLRVAPVWVAVLAAGCLVSYVALC